MSDPVSWEQTFAARFRATLGVHEPAFPSEGLVATMAEAFGRPPTGAELRQAQVAEAATFHNRLPVIDMPDTRSPVQRAAEQEAAMARTAVAVLDDRQVTAIAAARQAGLQRTLLPGRPSSAPHWSSEKSQGCPWRMISFGPSITTFEEASQIVAQWQAEDMFAQSRSDAELAAKLPGYPR